MGNTFSLASDAAAYQHPGRLFIKQYGVPISRESVLAYPQFLRSSAGLTESPPVDLSAIYRRFGMAEPLRVPLVDQQGILVDGSTGLILIKEDDAIARQRFTEGHELMELLFDAIEQAGQIERWDHDEKERLCDQGAAELLMPRSQFTRDLQALDISLQSGRSLAKLYQTSLMSTLIHMMSHGSGSYALVLWHPAWRKKEAIAQQQKPANRPQPKKKLRVRWRCCTQNWSGGFIPPNKSVSSDSLITQAHRIQQSQVGTEWLAICQLPIHCYVEALPIRTNAASYVLSLLHSVVEAQ